MVKNPYTEDQTVRFVRIGQDREVPRLEIPAGRPEAVREAIHNYVAERLGTDQFSIQLFDGGGFIDLGTHSEGAFTLQPAPRLVGAGRSAREGLDV